jgi:hypothetical protein
MFESADGSFQRNWMEPDVDQSWAPARRSSRDRARVRASICPRQATGTELTTDGNEYIPQGTQVVLTYHHAPRYADSEIAKQAFAGVVGRRGCWWAGKNRRIIMKSGKNGSSGNEEYRY